MTADIALDARVRVAHPALRVAGVLGAYLVAQAAVLIAARAIAPRFFWFDDAEGQFGPTWWWLGATREAGRTATMDPDLGVAGAFAIDLQYGALDPFHWLLQAVLGGMTDVVDMSWAVAAFSLVLLGTGTCAVLLVYKVPAAIVPAAALAVSTSGFLLWFGSSWWPMLWSIGWFVWLWAGLASRGGLGAVVAGASLAAAIGAGNPYLLPFAALLAIVELVGRRIVLGSWRELVRTPDVLARVVACAGGVLIGLPSLLTLAGSSPVLERPVPEPFLGNSGFAVPSLFDAVMGGPSLLGQLNAWGSGAWGTEVAPAPALSAGLFALPLLALVDWRRALRVPGVLTSGVLTVVAFAATQAPAVIAGFRVPMRYLIVAQIALIVVAVVAVAGAPAFSRSRVVVAGGVVLAQFLLAASRSPALLTFHVLALGGMVVAVLLALALLRWKVVPLRRLAAALALLVVTAAVWPMQLGQMVAAGDRLRNIAADAAPGEGHPLRMLRNASPLTAATVDEHRDNSLLPDQVLTVLDWSTDSDRGWSSGVVDGNMNLFAGMRTGSGSLAIGQRNYQRHVCVTYLGTRCGGSEALLEVEPSTGVTWLDLTSAGTIALASDAPVEIRQHLERTRSVVGEDRGWTLFASEGGAPGRITWSDGVDIADDATIGQARPGVPMDAYRVSSAEGGTIVLRTPWWPGILARVDGQPVPVDAVDGAIVRIEIPAGADDSELTVLYEPLGVAFLIPSLLGGAVLVGASGLVGVLSRPSRGSLRGVDAHPVRVRTRT